MNQSKLIAIDAPAMPWEERFENCLGDPHVRRASLSPNLCSPIKLPDARHFILEF